MAETGKGIKKKEAEAPERIERTWARGTYSPQVDILERKDDIMVFADMPGVDERSVDINLDKNILSISGRVEEESLGNHRPLYAEYGTGDFERVFTLSDEIDRDRIQATVKNGVLRIILPKAAAVKSRRIAVKAEA